MKEITFQIKRLRVCWFCLWYLRHWPWSDIDEADWREQLEDQSAWECFVEGWCCE